MTNEELNSATLEIMCPHTFSISQVLEALNKSPKHEPKAKKVNDQVNPARGERGDFIKVTITLPLHTLTDLKRLGIERRLRGEKDTDVSSLIRESLKKFLPPK